MLKRNKVFVVVFQRQNYFSLAFKVRHCLRHIPLNPVNNNRLPQNHESVMSLDNSSSTIAPKRVYNMIIQKGNNFIFIIMAKLLVINYGGKRKG